jgi:hypothetical protein
MVPFLDQIVMTYLPERKHRLSGSSRQLCSHNLGGTLALPQFEAECSAIIPFFG